MADLSKFSNEEVVEAFEYLDELRESGATNMYAGAAYIQEDLEHDTADARALLSAWMKTFDGVTSAHQRARAALASEASSHV